MRPARLRPRPSLSLLCLAVAVVAVDLAWLREIFGRRRSILGFVDEGGDLVALPMVTVLLIGLQGLRAAPGPDRSFAIGFEASGFVALAALILLFRRFEVPAIMAFGRWITGPAGDLVVAVFPRSWLAGVGGISAIEVVNLLLFVAASWAPLLFLAWAGGHALARFGSRRSPEISGKGT